MEKKTIAELNDGIVLAQYKRSEDELTSYQTEKELEKYFINNLISQGYIYRKDIDNDEKMFSNLREKIEELNNYRFSDNDWNRFKEERFCNPNENYLDKTEVIQGDAKYEFTDEEGQQLNIKLIDKDDYPKNRFEVINQINRNGKVHNIYDVSILINGLPLVHIELKKRDVPLKNAFDQIDRYRRETFNTNYSLYQYTQIFVISNGAYTRYYANTNSISEKRNFDFTMQWADRKNNNINNLTDFTRTFFEKRVIFEILTKYCVFDTNRVLLIMRPYQIAATESIINKIRSLHENKNSLSDNEPKGGFIWHTTGSGKTLTSFKTAQLAMKFDFIKKVFFVVDRQDLDQQTVKEYEKFQKGCVNTNTTTKELVEAIEKNDDKIVLTTIQKLNNFIKNYPNHRIFNEEILFIYDECHRSLYGDYYTTNGNSTKVSSISSERRKKLKNAYQFGFTGTPITGENNIKGMTTSMLFGPQLHSYTITNAIRDEKVLKWKVDYLNQEPKFLKAEQEKDQKKIEDKEFKKLFKHPDRISKIVKYILDNFDLKTNRPLDKIGIDAKRKVGFNAMLCVDSVESAKLYYQEFKHQQKEIDDNKKIRVSSIFTFSPNQETSLESRLSGFEEFNSTDESQTDKEFLAHVIEDYNTMFGTNFSIDNVENYKKDMQEKIQTKELDLVIVVNMLLTGFNAEVLNTLFVDKNLQYHNLIQAFSRTNRLYNEVKERGNIVCFRDLKDNLDNALKVFGDENSVNVVLEKGFNNFYDNPNAKDFENEKLGYVQLCKKLLDKFPEYDNIHTEEDQKEFAKLWGEIISRESSLRNFDEFKEADKILTDHQKQDYTATYNEIVLRKTNGPDTEDPKEGVDWSDIYFPMDLIRSQEINLDYVLALIAEKTKEYDDKEKIKEEIERVINSSLDVIPKRELILDFIDQLDVREELSQNDYVEQFYIFARSRKEVAIKDFVENEKLKKEEFTYRYINGCIDRGYINSSGDEFSKILPPTGIFGQTNLRQRILGALQELVEQYKGI